MIKNVIVLCHGLNNSEPILNDLMHLLSSDECILIPVLLSGHQPDTHFENKLWLRAWLDDLKKATVRAKQIAHENHSQLHFVGYSFSCLLFLLMLSELKENPYQRALFFAPLLKAPRKLKFLKWLSDLRLPLMIPSLNLPKFRAHRWPPLSMYRAVFEAASLLESQSPKQWNLPILILMDPRDPVIPFESVKSWISDKKLKWTIIPILMENQRVWTGSFHLIIAKSTTGARSWPLLEEHVREFLK